MKKGDEATKRWLDNWREVNNKLEELRIKEIRENDVTESIASFDIAFKSALWLSPNNPTSGLIQLQELLNKLKK